jgi:hypothetical protein
MSEGAAQTTERFEVIVGADSILGKFVTEVLAVEVLVRRLVKKKALK